MSDLAGLTTCIHCGQTFSHPKFKVIGQPTARLQSYLEELGKHIAAKHPEQGLVMFHNNQAFAELMFLVNFRTTDEELAERLDRMRWQVHQQTLKARYPDENLDAQALELARTLGSIAIEHVDDSEAYSDLFADSIAQAFRSIRDALEEPGKYAPVEKKEEKLIAQ